MTSIEQLTNKDMKLTTIKFRVLFLLAMLALTATAQNTSDYSSVLLGTDWGWQSRGGVDYGKASFDDQYGSAQVVSIARYSESTLATSLYVKEHPRKELVRPLRRDVLLRI